MMTTQPTPSQTNSTINCYLFLDKGKEMDTLHNLSLPKVNFHIFVELG